jgi:hypothetical protein
MNAQRRPDSPASEATLRERAATARAATARRNTSAWPYDDPRAYAEHFDFSAFGVIDVARLHEVVKQLDIYLGHMSNMPLCTEPDERGVPVLTPVGRFIDFEELRITFLRDRCVREIAQRIPQTEEERDGILAARIAHALDCGHRVDRQDEPDLLLEALKAWG